MQYVQAQKIKDTTFRMYFKHKSYHFLYILMSNRRPKTLFTFDVFLYLHLKHLNYNEPILS